MLNELRVLRDSLQESGLAPVARHPDIFDVPARPGIVLGLSPDGSLGLVEECPPERMATLWALRDGKHNSFPVVPIKAPFLHVDAADPVWTDLDAADEPGRLALLRDAATRFPVHESPHTKWWKSRKKRLKERLVSLERASPSDDLSGLLELIRRLGSIDLKTFLESSVSRMLEAGTSQLISDLAYLQELLVGRLKLSRRGRTVVADSRLVFDLADFPSFPLRVATPEMVGPLSEALIRFEEVEEEASGTCAFSGLPGVLNEGSFPQVRLPLLGETPLFSMFGEARCQTRYGMTGSSVFPVGREVVMELEASLRMLTAESREGKTWTRIPSEVPGGAYLLIAYLAIPAADTLETALLLAGNISIAAEASFESVTKRFFGAVRGLPVSPGDSVEIVVLRKVDPGRGQVVLRESLSVDELEAAARRWSIASQNLPRIRIQVQRRDEPGVWVRSPILPFPLRVAGILTHQWIRGGEESHKVQGGLSVTEIFGLFLRPNHRAAGQLLALTLKRSETLLVSVGHLLHRDSPKAWSGSLSRRGRTSALNCVSLIGLALSFLGSDAEEYMKEAAYQVGRLMSLADQLHREYCRGVRSAKLPPRLVGNSLMRSTLSNPRDGVSLLAQRILPYQAWAATAEGKASALAKWILGQMGEVSRELGTQNLPTRTDEAIRGQMLLGYLARPECRREEDANGTEPVENKDDHNG